MCPTSKLSLSEPSRIILRSKITPPKIHQDMQLRSRLLSKISDFTETSLLIIQAPAGYGKTTLLKQLYHQLTGDEYLLTWLSLYHTENEPLRFIAHISAAFGALEPDINVEMEPFFTATPAYPINEVLSSLLCCLNRFSKHVVVILDDFHEINRTDVHQVFSELLTALPTNIHCIIASRVLPAIDFHKLPLVGKVDTIDAQELRFSIEETASYIKKHCQFTLPDDNLQEFMGQTEGWIMAIKLAAKSTLVQQEQFNLQQFVSDSHHGLVDYLTEAVLNQHSEETRNFLLQTAPLGRLSMELCDAVTQQNNAQIQLEILAKENLFINVLDEEQKTYRYHSLFSEFLCGLLAQYACFDLVKIHQRASRWYSANGMSVEAAEHAVKSGDKQFIIEVIEAQIQEMTRAGQVARLLLWLKQLPEATLANSINLLTHLGWCQVLTHQPKEAAKSVNSAKTLHDKPELLSMKEQNQLPENFVELLLIDQWITQHTVEKGTDIKTLLVLQETINPHWYFIHSALNHLLGNAYFHQDKLEQAIDCFEYTIVYAKKVPNAILINMAIHNIAQIRLFQGDFAASANLCQRALITAVDRQNQPLPVSGRFHSILAKIYYEGNQLSFCREHLNKAISFYEYSSDPELLAETEILAAKLVLIEHGERGYVSRLFDAERLISRRGASTQLNRIRAMQVTAAIKVQDVYAAEAMLRQCSMPLEQISPPLGFYINGHDEEFYIALCHYWIIEKDFKKATAWLRQLMHNAQENKRYQSTVILNCLTALLYVKQNQSNKSMDCLKVALNTAMVHRFMRCITDLGQDIIVLVEGFHKTRTSEKNDAEAQDHLSQFTKELLTIAHDNEESQASASLLLGSDNIGKLPTGGESLTPREIQILGLLAQGMKNIDIAEDLMIAESSVRWHIKNLYSKLDVHNRTAATVIGRELKLVR